MQPPILVCREQPSLHTPYDQDPFKDATTPPQQPLVMQGSLPALSNKGERRGSAPLSLHNQTFQAAPL